VENGGEGQEEKGKGKREKSKKGMAPNLETMPMPLCVSA